MLMVGASTTCSPSALASRAIAAPTSRVTSGLKVAANAAATGKTVAIWPVFERTPVGPSLIPSRGTPSRSTPTSLNASAPAISATFSSSVRRASRSATRASSGLAGSW